MKTRSGSNWGIPFTQPYKNAIIELTLSPRYTWETDRALGIWEASRLAPSVGMSAGTDLCAVG
jgi:hypothetical protein